MQGKKTNQTLIQERKILGLRMQENNNLWEQILELRIQKKTASQDNEYWNQECRTHSQLKWSSSRNWSCSMNTGIDNAEELIIYNNKYWNWECRNCKHKMMMMQIKYSNYSIVFRCRWRSWKRDLLFTQCSKVQIDAAAAAEWKESDMNQHKGSKQVHRIFFCSGKEEEQEEEEEEEEGHSQFLEKFVVLTKTGIENAEITTQDDDAKKVQQLQYCLQM